MATTPARLPLDAPDASPTTAGMPADRTLDERTPTDRTTPRAVDDEPVAARVKARLCAESRLIARLMHAEAPALHDECEAHGLPHEGRLPPELRAALFNLLRRRIA